MNYDYIVTRRDKNLFSKEDTFKLISDCYSGGQKFRDGGHLFQYTREPSVIYKERQKRAIYINFVQPLTDMLVGFLYKQDPSREIKGDQLEDFITMGWKNKSFEAGMRFLCTHSLLFTCGVLIDSPSFDDKIIKNEADRKSAGLFPYMTIYYPWQIRDYGLDDKGNTDWIILDDSYEDKEDPFEKSIKKECYTLWTKTYFQRFEIKVTDKGESTVEGSEEISHPCKEVPFVFSNWKDVEDDYISESVFEDIAFNSRNIYNYWSYIDEMLASSAFKTLFFPCKNVNEDIPKDIQKKGFADLAVVPFRGDIGTPFFAGPSVESIPAYLETIMNLSKEVFKKVGLDKDEDKGGTQSGEAKRREFNKAVSLLSLGATNMETVEKKCLQLVGAWNKNYTNTIKVTYSKDFDEADITDKLERLRSALEIPVFNLQKAIYKIIMTTTLKEDLSPKELAMFAKEIDALEEVEPIFEEEDSEIENPEEDITPDKKSGDDIKGQPIPADSE